MTQEMKYLLDCTRAYLYNEKLNEPSDINFDSLFQLAKIHNLSPVVFSVIKDNPSAIENRTSYKLFEQSFFDSIARYDFQSRIIGEIDELLSSNKLRHIFFKGAKIREYYPIPELRSMGDVDLLIYREDRESVKRVLISHGYELVNSNGPVYDYKKDGVLIEVHTKIVSGKVGKSNAEMYFENAVDYARFDGYSGELEKEYHFCYLITHIAHHFWFYGAGVKMILDLAVMQQHFDLDFDIIERHLKALGLYEFAKTILTICKKWYGFGSDFGVETKNAEEFLLSFGAFGNSNRNKAAVVKRKALEEGKKSGFATKIALLFPSYQKLKDIPYMRFMEGRPYLLIYGWIYRIFYNFKYRKDFVKQTTSNLDSAEDETQAEKEIKFFEEIGLL